MSQRAAEALDTTILRGSATEALETAVLRRSATEALDTAVLRRSEKRAAPAGVSLRPGTAVSIACDRRCCWSVNESGDESGSRLPAVIIRRCLQNPLKKPVGTEPDPPDPRKHPVIRAGGTTSVSSAWVLQAPLRSDRSVAPPAFRFLSLSPAAPLSPTECGGRSEIEISRRLRIAGAVRRRYAAVRGSDARAEP
jgi:hypothetical protein